MYEVKNGERTVLIPAIPDVIVNTDLENSVLTIRPLEGLFVRIDIATLFPEMCEAILSESIVGRARKKGALEIYCHQIRVIQMISTGVLTISLWRRNGNGYAGGPYLQLLQRCL